MFYFLFLFQKAKNNRLKKASWSKFCNISFLFLLKMGLVGHVDQQINLTSPYMRSTYSKFVEISKKIFFSVF